MAEIVFSNTEQVIHYMIHNLRLSRVDEKFLTNIQLIINKKEKVTTNQVTLFNKIVGKYRRQLARHGFFVEQILALPWKSMILESSTQYTNAHITISDGKIFLRSPYNKGFITDLKKNPIYSLKWDTVNRYYEISYSTDKLKRIIDLVKSHYTSINYCDTTSKLLSHLEQFKDIRYWQPTLVYSNGYLFIKAANESVIEATSKINFIDLPKTISDLAYYGISIDDSVIEHLINSAYDSGYIEFLTSYSLVYEITEIPKVIRWLQSIECDCIIDTNRNWMNSSDASDAIKESKIFHTSISFQLADISPYERPVFFTFKMYGTPPFAPQKPYKVIRFLNSQPVKLINEAM